MAVHDPSRIQDNDAAIAASPAAQAANSGAVGTTSLAPDSVVRAGRHPNVNPFDPSTPAGNPPPLAPPSAYIEED